jgi:hypothetical protein
MFQGDKFDLPTLPKPMPCGYNSYLTKPPFPRNAQLLLYQAGKCALFDSKHIAYGSNFPLTWLKQIVQENLHVSGWIEKPPKAVGKQDAWRLPNGITSDLLQELGKQIPLKFIDGGDLWAHFRSQLNYIFI